MCTKGARDTALGEIISPKRLCVSLLSVADMRK